MWLIKMAWKNMWRNRNRTVITMAAIFFAVILSVITSSLKTGIFDNLVKNVVSFYTGYVQVHKQGYWSEQILDNSFDTSGNIENKILSTETVSQIAPRLESFALASSKDITKGCLIVGIDPQKENDITRLKSKLIEGNYLKNSDPGVLLSEGLAKRLQLIPGDTIVLISQGFHGATAAGKYRIQGILKFGSPELNDKALFMPLPLAQDLFSAYGMITSYVLSLKNPKLLEQTAQSIRSAIGSDYEVMTWKQMMPEIQQHIATDSNNMQAVQALLYLLISFGIFSTLLMLMVERKFEMGMLVAVGMKKIKLAILLLIESILTVISGCVLGILVSIPLVYYLNKHPIRLGGETAKIYERFGFEAIFPTSTNIEIFISQGIIVLVIGLILSLYPVYKTIRLNPVAAMKK
ncbi:MAG: ABC transporter permease [Bacteroidota bacterium]|nr:ABC transporter permease [Bacteroidota bacterium]